MGGGTELIFVEGNSTDDTFATIEREIAAHPETARSARPVEEELVAAVPPAARPEAL